MAGIKLKSTPKAIKKQLKELGLGVFTARQVSQLKSRLKKQMANDGSIPNCSMNFGTLDLRNWCLSNSTIPDAMDKPFVLFFNIVETLPAHYTVFVTTKHLLWKLGFIHCLQVDAAHKMLVGKHKVLVAGGSDANRKFHPVLIGISSNENRDCYEDLFEALKRWAPLWYPSAIMSDTTMSRSILVKKSQGSSLGCETCCGWSNWPIVGMNFRAATTVPIRRGPGRPRGSRGRRAGNH